MPDVARVLGYELVEKEPVSFEGAAREGQSWHVGCSILADPRLVPGKKYKVTEVVE